MLFVSLVCGAGCSAQEVDNPKAPQDPNTTVGGKGPDGPGNPETPSNQDDTQDLGIATTIPSTLDAVFRNNFNRYTSVQAPNGMPIHIVAQDKISREQILRTRGILEHYLRDLPGSKFGADKSQIANQMAKNGAILCLLNGQDDGKNPVGGTAPCQPLYQNEIQVEGHAWYMEQNYEHRDASFEEILHLVHDFGIGVDGPGTRPGAATKLQAEIRAAQVEALSKKIWGKDEDEWIEELTRENSLSQEYLASVIDSYYGLWGAYTQAPGLGMWGFYEPKTRQEIASEDPLGAKLVQEVFFHPHLTYTARVDTSFSGVFSLKFDPSMPYTHHARYLQKIKLLGANPVDVVVNELDNEIEGNAGPNAVVFSGERSKYLIEKMPDHVMVRDQRPSGDGHNRLEKVETLRFTDQTVDVGK